MVAGVRLQVHDVDVDGRVDAARLRVRIAHDFRVDRVSVGRRVPVHQTAIAAIRVEMVVQVVQRTVRDGRVVVIGGRFDCRMTGVRMMMPAGTRVRRQGGLSRRQVAVDQAASTVRRQLTARTGQTAGGRWRYGDARRSVLDDRHSLHFATVDACVGQLVAVLVPPERLLRFENELCE